ncbi:MAG: lipoyl synthase [Clostridiales Family XIII bacterium]|jgi:lipoic acid synthetase|nr:lipoyl synthase [Clostridiales Family XIII bacterium]
MSENQMDRKPEWLRKTYAADPNRDAVEALLEELNLNTVCREAHCPNYMECFASKTATFMILGTNCTRNCRFCNVRAGVPQPLDPQEPERTAEAVKRLGLRYAVITSVTRDDLPDGGASQFADVVEAIRRHSPDTATEVLVPDFKGSEDALARVADAKPSVISHNMETVAALYPAVRPQADYRRSLDLIRGIKQMNPDIRSKSGIMLGLGETKNQVTALFDDLRAAGCEFLTIGQYLAPSRAHHPVCAYVHPDQFAEYAEMAKEKGFSFVASAPFVRSSYHAGEALGL